MIHRNLSGYLMIHELEKVQIFISSLKDILAFEID